MTLQIFVFFVKDGEGKPRVGVLLAEDQGQAIHKAVNHCKASFGPTSRVTLVSPVGEADIRKLYRTRAFEVMHKWDQVIVTAMQMDDVTTKAIELVETVRDYVIAMKTELENNSKEENEK